MLFDHDKGMIMGSVSEFLGMAEISIDSLVTGVKIEDWYTLQWSAKYQKKQEKITGRVMLSIEAQSSMSGKSEAEVEELKSTKKAVRDVKKAEGLRERGFGTLEITVVSAERLMAADRGGTSDPFVELNCGGKKVKTTTKKKTLNPTWDEVFIMEVSNKAVSLEVSIFDADMVGSAFLGLACINLDDLPEGKDVLKSYPVLPRSLKDKNPISGSVRLLCNYLLKAPTGLKLPQVDKASLEARRAKLGVGSCTFGVVGALQLMGNDPGSAPNTYVEVKIGENRSMTDVLQGTAAAPPPLPWVASMHKSLAMALCGGATRAS